jgi:small subunit ribosomal protein S16
MVKIRLRRVGAKKQPHYRVVVADSHTPRDGRFIETIGSYNPRTEPPTVEINAERALYWLGVGAQPSAAVQRLLDKMGLMSQVTAVRQGEVSAEKLAEELRPTVKSLPRLKPRRKRPGLKRMRRKDSRQKPIIPTRKIGQKRTTRATSCSRQKMIWKPMRLMTSTRGSLFLTTYFRTPNH